MASAICKRPERPNGAGRAEGFGFEKYPKTDGPGKAEAMGKIIQLQALIELFSCIFVGLCKKKKSDSFCLAF